MDPDYDPRTRPWYVQAQREETAFYTEPYVFSSTKLPGVTCAEKLISGGGVFGVDITLDRFSVSLERQKVSDNGVLFLFDRSGRIIAHPGEDPTRRRQRGEHGFYLRLKNPVIPWSRPLLPITRTIRRERSTAPAKYGSIAPPTWCDRRD